MSGSPNCCAARDAAPRSANSCSLHIATRLAYTRCSLSRLTICVESALHSLASLLRVGRSEGWSVTNHRDCRA